MEDIIANEFGNQENQTIPNYTIDELRSIHSLSLRAYRLCSVAKLNDLKSIIDFFNAEKEEQLLKIRNCGIHTIREIKYLYNHYKQPEYILDMLNH